MKEPNIIPEEAERINELYKYELLDSVYEEEFDEIVKLASQICDVQISLITLIDVNRQWFKAKLGLDVTETARNISFCGHAIGGDELFTVNDATTDERFFDNPLVVGEPNIKFYAGMPLKTSNGYAIGTLCVIDKIPKQLTPWQEFALNVLSKNIIKLFELRLKNNELDKILSIQQKIMGVMSHDIRGPLQSLGLSFDLKNNGDLTNDEIIHFDAIVQNQLKNTIDLLNNIVDWSKLQLSNKNEAVSLFNVHELCNNCFGYLLLAAEIKHNKLINNIDTNLAIKGSKQGLEFILRNLLNNANKFTTNGEISVSAFLDNNKIILTIIDTGVGISEKTIESIKQRTWTNYTPGTQNEKGSGTGLKLVFEYLSNAKGEMKITSKIGEGTIVEISYPVLPV